MIFVYLFDLILRTLVCNSFFHTSTKIRLDWGGGGGADTIYNAYVSKTILSVGERVCNAYKVRTASVGLLLYI